MVVVVGRVDLLKVGRPPVVQVVRLRAVATVRLRGSSVRRALPVARLRWARTATRMLRARCP